VANADSDEGDSGEDFVDDIMSFLEEDAPKPAKPAAKSAQSKPAKPAPKQSAPRKPGKRPDDNETLRG
jgi:hypothetical protein